MHASYLVYLIDVLGNTIEESGFKTKTLGPVLKFKGISKGMKITEVWIGAYREAMSFSNGNWQSQYVLFIKMLQFFGTSASIYCPGAAIIIENDIA